MHTEDNKAGLLRALEEIAPLVRRQAAEAEQSAALSQEVVGQLVREGLFRLWIPRRYGGFELSLPAALEVYQAAARIDGSFGWAVMIGAGGGLFAAFLGPEAAREIFGPAPAVIAGSGTPEGRAERVPGGYRVSGQWRYASGAPYATTFTANCVVTRGGEPEQDAVGQPLIRAMAFALDDVRILATWNPVGMRGTASHDFRVEDAFVPERHSFSLATPPFEPGPLYRLPFMVLTELPLSAVALGIMQHALDAFAATPADDPMIHSTFARAHASWRLAQSGVTTLAERTWSAAMAGRELTVLERADITATCVQSVSSLRRAADELAALAGMSAIRQASDLSRAWRDLITLAAHFSVSPRQLAAAGSGLLNGAPGRS
ncbi:MAG: acyl-CoA dehydrogenase family protein [Steroidobacteraceae bacterium]